MSVRLAPGAVRALPLALAVTLAPAIAWAAPSADRGPPRGDAAAPKLRATTAPRPVVAIFPLVTATPAAQDLAFALQEKAAAVLAETGGYHEIHVKQILRMAEREGIAPAALADEKTVDRAAGHLGATRVVFGRLSAAAGSAAGYVLEVSAHGAGVAPASTSSRLPGNWAAAVRAGGVEIARLVAGQDRLRLPDDIGMTQPASSSDAAMRVYAACYATVVRQPMGIETPSLLGADALGKAITECREATRLDAGMGAAWAALGLALALAGDDREAVAALAKAKLVKGYLPLYWLARYWLVTRYQSNQAGAAVLRAAINQHPGFMLARAYLAEHLNALGQHGEALAAWHDYATECPQSPFAQARIGYTHARLGAHTKAIEHTRRALARDGQSSELLLELASRQLDSGQPRESIATLKPLVDTGRARGEVLLRVGYAYLLAGDLDRAEPLLRKAVTVASRPAEWRTRGRAWYDLAKLLMRRKQPEAARRALATSMGEGFTPRTSPRLDQDLRPLLEAGGATQKPATAGGRPLDLRVRPESVQGDARASAGTAGVPGTAAAAGAAGAGAPSPPPPRQTSPFPLTPAGEVDPEQPRPQPPLEFQVIQLIW